ncbi:hypothetical protein NXF25_013327 [Crotalus adamanteus]|uniref:CCHC-type domain-containing protein n=1 Tax=Crotalus adamanteus TaxID=8729 RepID=A0AAW1BFS5_CROAD
MAVFQYLRGCHKEGGGNLFSKAPEGRTRELADIGLFLDALKTRFEDPTRLQRAEAQLVGLRQRGRPVQEYIREFQKVAGRLRSWPHRLLVHYFRTGLDTDLHRACVVRGIVGRLSEWFKAAMELDVGLRDLSGTREERPQPRRSQDQPKDSTNQMPISNVRPKPVFRCFRCNRPGHRTAECTFPESIKTPTAVGRPGGTPKKMTENSRAAHQLGQLSGQQAPGDAPPALEEYEEEGPVEDPMVSYPIVPFTIPITLTSPVTGESGSFQALIDTGCTRCLISREVARQMHMRVTRLKAPIRFEQVDGSLLGGAPTTLVTEPVRMEIDAHWEVIRFIVVPSMSESIILSLAWLDKWTPNMWWADGSRHIRLAVGPQLPCPSENSEDKVSGDSKSVQAGSDPGYPAVYNDLAAVFSEQESDSLPSHRSTDCAIEIVPGAKLPKPRMYPMTFSELQEMRKYIDKNLNRGFIEPDSGTGLIPREKGWRIKVMCGLSGP